MVQKKGLASEEISIEWTMEYLAIGIISHGTHGRTS